MLVIRGGTAKTEESVDDVVRRARDYVAEGESSFAGRSEGGQGVGDSGAVRSTSGW